MDEQSVGRLPQRNPVRIAFLTIVAVIVGLVGPFALTAVAPAAAQDCLDRNLYVVAHQDDDLLFQNPDLFRDGRPGWCTRTIFMTAGDAGLSNDYWQSREAGIEAAYAQMSGVSNSWTTSDASVPGRNIRVRTLVGNPALSVVFMRLPDGYGLGTGTAARGYQSLQKLLQGSIGSISTVDGSGSYTAAQLRSTMTALINSFAPDYLHTQDYTGSYGDGDHSDHHASAYVVRDALAGYPRPYNLFSHRGYGVEYLPANVSGGDLQFKRNLLNTYAAYDSQVCHFGCFPNENELWSLWSARQYYTDVTSSPGSIAPVGTTNVARLPGVAVAASSETAWSGQYAVKAVDGSTLGSPIDHTREWATDGGKAASWISLTFPEPVSIERVVLYDRPNSNDHVTQAYLEFPDGTSMTTGALDNAGGATIVNVPKKTVSSLRVVITGVSASTINTGLAEIEVYGNVSVPVAEGNVARDPGVAVTASSQDTANGSGAEKAVDGSTLGWPVDLAKEWVTVGGKANHWLQLQWPSAQTVDRVVLYDRPNDVDNVTEGTLRFSDGSTISTGPLDPLGGPTVITFPTKTTTSLRFTIDAVSPGTANSGLAEIEVFREGAVRNNAPVAAAGQNQSVTTGSTVTLDGTASNDPDGSRITYSWAQLSGPSVTLTNATTATPSFVARADGTYQFELTVSDGALTSRARVSVTAEPIGADGNVAPLATASASSQNTSTQQTAAKAIDGSTLGSPTDYTREWASVGGGAGQWLQLTWPSAVTIDEIVLHDRPNSDDQVLSGTLAFSDGTTVGVGALANNGSATTVSFAPREVTSVRFTIQSVSASTLNIGLAEIKAMTSDVSAAQNVARIAGTSVTASSDTPAWQQTAAKAVDGAAIGNPIDYTREWATNGGGSGSWIELTLANPVTIDTIVLYDRPNAVDRVTGGQLTFSDGSSVNVGALDNGYGATTITFPAKTVTSVRFTITSVGAGTLNVGLAEIEVYGAVADAGLFSVPTETADTVESVEPPAAVPAPVPSQPTVPDAPGTTGAPVPPDTGDDGSGTGGDTGDSGTATESPSFTGSPVAPQG